MNRLSDYLREEREKKGLSLANIAEETNIKEEFLRAIEAGQLHKLPSYSYALGFVKTYATYLDLPQQKIVAFFRREYADEKLEIVPQYRKKQHTFHKRILFSPQGLVILAVFFIIAGYIAFQYGPLFFGPRLTVSTPRNGDVIKESVMKVAGMTDKYATVTINQEEALVDLHGEFKKTLYLFPGERTITVVAKNRFGKETREILTVKVQ